MKTFFRIVCIITFTIVPLWANAQELNDANDYYRQATQLMSGDEIDFGRAIELLHIAHQKGSVEAGILLQVTLSPGHNGWGSFDFDCAYDAPLKPELLQKYIDYAKNGDSYACLALGINYFHSFEYEIAVNFFKKGLLCMDLSKNDGKSQHLTFRGEPMKAEVTNISLAMNLGYCYEHGLGVEKDLEKAFLYYIMGGWYWDETDYIDYIFKKYSKEIDRNYIDQYYDSLMPYPFVLKAWDRGSILLVKMKRYTDANHAYSYFDKVWDEASDKFDVGRPGMLLWMAERQLKGLGVPVNAEKAYEMFNVIVNKMEGPWGTRIYYYFRDVYSDACYRLYEMNRDGIGCKKNPSLASLYFKMAIQYGSSSALYDKYKQYL